jgi:hypothetical protein
MERCAVLAARIFFLHAMQPMRVAEFLNETQYAPNARAAHAINARRAARFHDQNTGPGQGRQMLRGPGLGQIKFGCDLVDGSLLVTEEFNNF